MTLNRPPYSCLSLRFISLASCMRRQSQHRTHRATYVYLLCAFFSLSSHCVRIYLQALRQAEQKKNSFTFTLLLKFHISVDTKRESHSTEREAAKCFRKSSRGHVTRAASNYHYRMHSRRIFSFFSSLSSSSFHSSFDS